MGEEKMTIRINPGDLVEIISGCPGCAVLPEDDPDLGLVFQVEWIQGARSTTGDYPEPAPMSCHLCGHQHTDVLVRLAGYKDYSSPSDGMPGSFLKVVVKFENLAVLQPALGSKLN
jgi:hypothetical protein